MNICFVFVAAVASGFITGQGRYNDRFYPELILQCSILVPDLSCRLHEPFNSCSAYALLPLQSGQEAPYGPC